MILEKRDRSALVRGGFTLMEVLVVVAILVVLAGTGGVIYLRVQEDQYKNTAKIQAQVLSDAVDMYKVKYGDYPASLLVLTQPPQDGGSAYLEEKALYDPWNRPYQYAYPGSHHPNTGKPDIWSEGPHPGDPNSMIGNW